MEMTKVDASLAGGEVEFDSGRGYDFFDHKGAKPLMIQLLGWTGGHIVLGIQPYLSSDFIDRCRAPLMIVVSCHLIHCMLKGSLHLFLHMALYPLDSSSSLIVSMEMTSQQWLGIRFGESFPTFSIRKNFQCLQPSHPAM